MFNLLKNIFKNEKLIGFDDLENSKSVNPLPDCEADNFPTIDVIVKSCKDVLEKRWIEYDKLAPVRLENEQKKENERKLFFDSYIPYLLCVLNKVAQLGNTKYKITIDYDRYEAKFVIFDYSSRIGSNYYDAIVHDRYVADTKCFDYNKEFFVKCLLDQLQSANIYSLPLSR